MNNCLHFGSMPGYFNCNRFSIYFSYSQTDRSVNMIQFKNVTKRYGNKTAVDDLTFNIEEGETFVLIGPSGCGKTTTLKMINRLIPLTSGYIYFKDRPISDYQVYEMRWDIGYVLQQIALFPHMTIKENIAQVPLMKKWPESDIDGRIDELLDMVGMDPEQFKNRKPSELSGGQQQRVGVVRALAADPPVILMDEPFSALDPISREKLQDDLVELQKKIRKTIVFVTHDIQEAPKLSKRIYISKDGHANQIGPPDEFLTSPRNDFVKNFIGDLDAHRMQQLTIGDIAQKHLPEASASHSDYPSVPADTQIQVAFQYLSEHDGIIVNGGNGAEKVLHSPDVCKSLADRQAGDAGCIHCSKQSMPDNVNCLLHSLNIYSCPSSLCSSPYSSECRWAYHLPKRKKYPALPTTLRQ